MGAIGNPRKQAAAKHSRRLGPTQPTHLLHHCAHERPQLDHVLQKGLERGLPQRLHRLQQVGQFLELY